MKLMHDIIIRRLDLSKDFSLNGEEVKCIWSFYQVYKICLNVLGLEDKQLSKKNALLSSLVLNPNNFSTFQKIKSFMVEDNLVIQDTLDSLADIEDGEEVYENFYPPNLIGVNIDDR